MGALPISTIQPSTPPATAAADGAADPGGAPAGPEGNFQSVLARNLAGQAARTESPASQPATVAAEDGKGTISAVLFPELLGQASGTRGQPGASTLLAADDDKAAFPATLATGINGDAVGASTLPAEEDGKTDVAMLAPELAGQACVAKGDAKAAKDGKAIDEAIKDETAKDGPAASDGPLPSLAVLLQPVAAPETQALAAADHKTEGVATERAPNVELRSADTAGAKPAHAGHTEPGPVLRFDPDKSVERAAHGAEALPDALPTPGTHGAHPALHSGHALAPLGIDPAAAGPARAPAAPRIDTPLGAPGWSTALADRVMMFVGDKQQVAELHINPPHLGPVEITLTMSDDRASAVFASPHAAVRETIESSLPRLREVLAESGINLGQASVTADSPRDGSAQAQAQSRPPFGSGNGGRSAADGTPLGASALAAARHARGMVDLFA